jgi:C-terminal processing protease CtpA/Prc
MTYGTARELQGISPDVHLEEPHEEHTHEEHTHEEHTHEEHTHEAQMILSISPQKATNGTKRVDGRCHTSCRYVID